MGSRDDTLQLSTAERMSALATTKAGAERLKAAGTAIASAARQGRATEAAARTTLDDWPPAPKMVGQKLLEHYGPPHEMTPTRMFWYDVGPWSRMELTASEVVHNFPTAHTDFLTQYIKWPVRADRVGDLVRFDGSVLVDRTTGEIGARCDHEAFNVLTLNLVVEILDGRRTVEEARSVYADTAAAFTMGRDAQYAEQLLFTPAEDETADPDEAVIAPHMVDQMLEKLKDLLGDGQPPEAQ